MKKRLSVLLILALVLAAAVVPQGAFAASRKIRITLSTPSVGATAGGCTPVGDGTVSIQNVIWLDQDGTMMKADTKFEGGKSYTLAVAMSGVFQSTDDISVTFNGKAGKLNIQHSTFAEARCSFYVAENHKWSDWKVTKEATDSSVGKRTRTCTTCGETESENFYPEGTLYKGMSNNQTVKKMQKILKELGYLKGAADGTFGDMTEKALKAFQKNAGLAETGIAYPQTLKALTAAYKGTTAEPAATRKPQPTSAVLQPEQTAVPGDKAKTDFCHVEDGAEGKRLTVYCWRHQLFVEMEGMLRDAASTDAEKLQAARQAKVLWQGAYDCLMEEWMERAGEEEQSLIANSRASFEQYLNTQREMWALQYAEDPAEVEWKTAAELKAQCVAVCGTLAE